MTRLLFLAAISILLVAGVFQVSVFSYLAQNRDAGFETPMHSSIKDPPGKTVASVNASNLPTPPVVVADTTSNHTTPTHVVSETWSPAMVILVVTSILTSLGGLLTLIITTVTKAKVEILKETSHRRDIEIQAVRHEVQQNTALTQRAADKVDEVDRKMPIRQSEEL